MNTQKTFTRRNNQIRSMRKNKIKLRMIADVFGISSERVRQICMPYLRCEKHAIEYRSKCYLCKREEFQTKLKTLGDKNFQKELAAVRKADRTWEMVERRIKVMRTLKDVYHLSYSAIGRLLNRDHSTVMHDLNKRK